MLDDLFCRSRVTTLASLLEKPEAQWFARNRMDTVCRRTSLPHLLEPIRDFDEEYASGGYRLQ